MAVTGRNKPKRNYRNEAKYDSQPHVKRKRVNRNLARRRAMRKGLVKKGDGKDVHHLDGNALNKNGRTAVVSASKNRSYARTRTAGKRNRMA
jgi:hypothetical protein|tara:strand:+ start:1223 stop:1498 length:276 start_codon:yes stop_codon:yes gene_type:complete